MPVTSAKFEKVNESTIVMNCDSHTRVYMACTRPFRSIFLYLNLAINNSDGLYVSVIIQVPPVDTM